MRREQTSLQVFPTGYDTNWAIQPQKMVRGLKFQILKEGGLFYLCSENDSADQLGGYGTADLF